MKSFRFITSLQLESLRAQFLVHFCSPCILHYKVHWSVLMVDLSYHCDEIISTEILEEFFFISLQEQTGFLIKKIYRIWISRIDHFSLSLQFFGLLSYHISSAGNSVCCCSTCSQHPEVLPHDPSYSVHPAGFLLEQESYSKILSLHSRHQSLYTPASQLRSSTSGVLTCPSLLWGLNTLVIQDRVLPVSFSKISFHLHWLTLLQKSNCPKIFLFRQDISLHSASHSLLNMHRYRESKCLL